MENGDVEALGGNDAEAGIGVPQHQNGVGLRLDHEGIALGDDIADGLSQVLSHGVQIVVRRTKSQVVKKHLIQRVVVVLPGVDKDLVKIPVTALDGGRQADDLRPRANDGHELQLAHLHTSSK